MISVNTNLPNMYSFNGSIILPYTQSHVETMAVSHNIADEIWLMLHHVSEVETVSKKLLCERRYSKTTPETLRNAWKILRAYIRQGESFYRGAQTLPWKSAPLNYYYAFMNLVKALLVMEGEIEDNELSAKIMHGISINRPELGKDLTDQNICIYGEEGIFHKFYGLNFGKSLPTNIKFSVWELLSYCFDIQWQYKNSDRSDQTKVFHCKRVVLSKDNSLWELIAIPNGPNPRVIWQTFKNTYNQVERNKEFAKRILDLNAWESSHFNFFQGKNVRREPVAYGDFQKDLNEAMPGAIHENVIKDGFQFQLNTPYDSAKGSIPMNEFVACYAIMFFLSSCVRYFPEYLDYMEETVDYWVMESFVRPESRL